MQSADRIETAHDEIGLALTLIGSFGLRARSAAEKEAAGCAAEPEVAARWKDVAAMVTTLLRAGAHMEIALGLLDSIGETSVPPRLDDAIVRLGVRSRAEAAYQLDRDDAADAEAHFSERAREHLSQASGNADPATKAIHLDLASHYVTLRELAQNRIEAEA